MQEYFTEALVLDKEPNGDLDSRIIILTKNFGKLIAKAKSARRITSKLAGHLEPTNFIKVRLVEKNGLQIVDALKTSRSKIPLADLYFLSQLLAEGEPEPAIWDLLFKKEFSWPKALKILGWDPDSASCASCPAKAASFHLKTQEFFCQKCLPGVFRQTGSSKIPAAEVIYLNK